MVNFHNGLASATTISLQCFSFFFALLTNYKINHLNKHRRTYHQLMDILSDEAHSEIISWLPHGTGFMIHKKKTFAIGKGKVLWYLSVFLFRWASSLTAFSYRLCPHQRSFQNTLKLPNSRRLHGSWIDGDSLEFRVGLKLERYVLRVICRKGLGNFLFARTYHCVTLFSFSTFTSSSGRISLICVIPWRLIRATSINRIQCNSNCCRICREWCLRPCHFRIWWHREIIWWLPRIWRIWHLNSSKQCGNNRCSKCSRWWV